MVKVPDPRPTPAVDDLAVPTGLVRSWHETPPRLLSGGRLDSLTGTVKVKSAADVAPDAKLSTMAAIDQRI